MLHQTWATPLHDITWSTPAVINRHRENPIVVLGDNSGAVHAIDAKTGAVRWVHKTEIGVNAHPIPVDIDGDGIEEVLIGSLDSTLYALRSEDGSVVWKYLSGGSIRVKPAVGEVNGRQVVGFMAYDHAFYALDLQSGRLLWKKPIPNHPITASKGFSKGCVSSPVLFDVNRDGTPEFVFATRNKRVFALNAATGELVWHVRVHYDPDSSPSLAIIDGEVIVVVGAGEALSARGDNRMLGIDGRTGRVRWAYRAGGALDSSPTIAHLTPNSGLVAVEGSLKDGALYAVHTRDGKLMWRFQTGGDCCCEQDENDVCVYPDRSCKVYATPLIFEHDGKSIVVFGNNDHMLFVLDGATGEPLEMLETPGIVRSSPVMATIDGQSAIFVGCGAYLCRFDGLSVNFEWPMYKGDLANTGMAYAPTPITPAAPSAFWKWWNQFDMLLATYGVDSLLYVIYQIEKRFKIRLLPYTY